MNNLNLPYIVIENALHGIGEDLEVSDLKSWECVRNIPRKISLTVECPNVTLCYKVKMTFLNPKFNQIRMEIANFWLLFGL